MRKMINSEVEHKYTTEKINKIKSWLFENIVKW